MLFKLLHTASSNIIVIRLTKDLKHSHTVWEIFTMGRDGGCNMNE